MISSISEDLKKWRIFIVKFLANQIKQGSYPHCEYKKQNMIFIVSKNLLVYYCKCCNLIGYTLLAIYSSIDIE